VVLGGLGGITPVLLNIIAKDYRIIFVDFTTIVAFGYFLRCIALFIVGAVVAYLHNEKKKIRLFELGIIAPAILTAFINGAPIPKPSDSLVVFFEDRLIAYAQTVNSKPEVLTEPKESLISQFSRGLLSTPAEKKDYLVIIGDEYNKLEDAQSAQRKLLQTNALKDTNIFQANPNENRFYLSSGSYMGLEDAIKSEEKIQKAFPAAQFQMETEIKSINALKQ
jgi:hypothetical protein